MIGRSLGPYEITAALGAGGMGEVFRARDAKLNRDVAIKVLPAAFAQDHERVARFRREAQVLASLNHSNIAAIYGLEESDGTIALALELVAGEDLAKRIKRGAMPVDEAIAIAKQIAEGLEAAHEKGIVHRDLKPANVKLTPDGTVKILDFGLAKVYEAEAGASSSASDPADPPTRSRIATEAGLVLGTAAYMSPEQARGKPVDRRADIWSFGVVLFELLSGTRLFSGETVSDTLAAVLKTEPDWTRLPAGTPPSARRLLRRCLERDPRRRLQAIGEARIAFEEGTSMDAAASVAARGSGAKLRFAGWGAVFLLGLAAGWALLPRRGAGPSAQAVLRLDVGFPDEIEPLPALDGGFALSPDGQIVAMIGVKNGTRALFVRRLNSAETKEIRHTSLTSASFSPDSKSVAMLGSQLVTVSLADGARTVIVSNPDLAGTVAWAHTGIVFLRNGALWISPSQGGGARALTTLDSARREVVHAGQTVLPGGGTVLFSSLTAEPGTERIEAVSIAGGARTVVVERATTPVWSPTGHLLFERDGAVFAVPFDPGTAKTQGAATPVFSPGTLGTSANGSLGLRLAPNGTLLYVPVNFGSQRIVSVARDGSALALDMPRGQYTNPRVSPDGRQLIAVNSGRLLETLDLRRGSRSRLIGAAHGTSFAVWSQDGSRVVSRRFNRPFWISADGTRLAEVPSGSVNDFPSGAGPDPDSVICIRVGTETTGDVFLLSIDGKFQPQPLVATKAYEGGAQLSKDGRWLVYCADHSGQMQIHVRPYPALDRQWSVSEGPGLQPRWNATGREIYYRDGQSLMAVAFDGSGSEPLIGKAAAVFKDDYDLGQGLTIANYEVMPDGRFIMLRRDAQAGTLRIVLNWTEELKQILAKGGPH